MKEGRSLVDLAKELERRANAKSDYVAKNSALSMSVEQSADNDFERLLKLNVATDKFSINEIAHDQIGGWCDIPSKYYDRCRQHDPELLAHNVNTWLHRRSDEARMVRTLDGTARAFLSDRYRPMENEDLAGAILPIILDSGKYDLMSCEVTDRRLYLKVVGKELSRELAKTGNFLGDGRHKIVEVLFPAIVISNSEVGFGALSIQRALYNSGCSNLGIYHEKSMKRYHVGARHDLMPEDLIALLSEDTRKKTDAALWSQVRDVVTGAFDEAHFNALVDQVQGAQEDRLDKKADVVKVVKLASSRLGIREGEQNGILQALIEGGDLSRYGLHNAVTRFAQDKDLTYDRATELERIGAEVIELPKSDWQDIAMAS
jgi:hypothetical protein